MKELQRLLSHTRAAIDKYEMIENDDRIAVGVSGGKDSLALLCTMAELRSFYPKKFDITALTIDMGFNESEKIGAPAADYSEIEELCHRIGVEYVVKHTQIAKIIFDTRCEENPCSLCARMRHGSLHKAAEEIGCNKVALGHHFDDAAVTVMLNLFFGGRFGCFSPVTQLSRREMCMIRPFVSTEEKLIKAFVRKASLPVIKSPCPADKDSQRAYMKEYLFGFEKEHRGLYQRIVGALRRGEVDGWKE